MFWIVEYENGYYYDEEGELKLDICTRYFLNKDNALKEYELIKNRLSTITDPGFENIDCYCEFFADEERIYFV